jgi:hypothetical protein
MEKQDNGSSSEESPGQEGSSGEESRSEEAGNKEEEVSFVSCVVRP